MCIDHDAKFDVVYIKLKDDSNSYGDEIADGVVVFRDLSSDEVTGITIMDFNKRYKNNKIPKLPVEIDWAKIACQI